MDLVYLLAIAALLLIAVHKYFYLPLRYLFVMKRKFGEQVKCSFSPLVGQIKYVIRGILAEGNPFHDYVKLAREYPGYKGIAVAGQYRNEYICLSLDSIKDFTFSNSQFLKKMDDIYFLDQFIQLGLLFTDGEKWKKQRKTLSPKFTHAEFFKKLSMVNFSTDLFLSRLAENRALQQRFPTCRYFMNITGEVVLRFFLGNQDLLYFDDAKTVLLSQELQEIAIALGHQIFQIGTQIKVNLLGIGWWSKPHFEIFQSASQRAFQKRFHAFKHLLEKEIASQIAAYNAGKLSADCILHTLLRDASDAKQQYDPNQLCVEELMQQFFTFFFAGMDTTGITTGMTLFMLAKNPEKLAALKAELQTVLAGKRDVQPEDIEKLPYLASCVRETLRLHQTVGGLIPKICQKDLEFDGVVVPKDTIVYCPIQINGVLERNFEKADDYIPERWLDKQTNSEGYYAYIPFSAGPRNCLGQHLAMIEMKVIIAKFLRDFEPQLVPGKQLRKAYLLTQQPQDEFLFTAEPLAKPLY